VRRRAWIEALAWALLAIGIWQGAQIPDRMAEARTQQKQKGRIQP
jgi:hypothetical protein